MGAGKSRVRTTHTVGNKPAPKKRFSQNYLTDTSIAQKIVDALPIQPHDVIIEIGPGPGALTQLLSKKQCKRVVAVDIDPRTIEHIKLQPWFDPHKIELIHSDVLQLSVSKIRESCMADRAVVIGNIPYAITSDILFWLFDQRRDLASAVITMQREVARRCVGVPGTKDYGILSVASWFSSEAKLMFHIQPGSFFPKPEVTSSVVRFNFKEADPYELPFTSFMSFIRAAFGQRRKVMTNALLSWASITADVSIQSGELQAGFDLSRIRSESLTPDELARVYVSLKQSKHISG